MKRKHPWEKVEARCQCWVCGQVREQPERERFHFLTVWVEEDGKSSQTVTVHAGICWRVLEAVFGALAPDLYLLSNSAHDDRPGLPF